MLLLWPFKLWLIVVENDQEEAFSEGSNARGDSAQKTAYVLIHFFCEISVCSRTSSGVVALECQ